MALFSVNIPEHLVKAIRRTGRSEEEVIVEALERKFNSKSIPKQEVLDRNEVEKRLLKSGFIRNPQEYENEDVHHWLSLSENERSQLIEEITSLWLPDSPASSAIIEGRS